MTTRFTDLAGATISALKWSYAGAAIRAGSQALTGIVLARMLGPHPFGLVAVGWLVIGAGNLLADVGLGALLIQRESVSSDDIRYAFTIQNAAGIALAVAVWASSVPISRLFGQAELIWVVRALALVFVTQAFGQTAVSLLRRNLDFRSLQLCQATSYVAYLPLGVTLAYCGYGVWSLVIAQIFQSGAYSYLAYRRVRHPLRPLLSNRGDAMFGFGFVVMATNFLNYLIRSLDAAFVGRMFGTTSLGVYSRAYNLVSVPADNCVAALQSVLFPAYARAQDNDVRAKQAYLASIAAVALIAAPVFCGVAAAPRTVVESLYGPRWLSAVPLLVPLALAMPCHALMALAGPLIWGRGKVQRELTVQCVILGLLALVILAASRTSVVLVAWGVLGVYGCRFVLMSGVTLRLIRASWADLLRALQGGTAVALWTTTLIWALEKTMANWQVSPILRLGADMAVGAIGSVLLMKLLPRRVFGSELVLFANSLSRCLPGTIGNFARSLGAVAGLA